VILSYSGTLPGHARPPEIEFKLQQQKQSKFCVSALHDFGTQISETLKAPASKQINKFRLWQPQKKNTWHAEAKAKKKTQAFSSLFKANLQCFSGNPHS